MFSLYWQGAGANENHTVVVNAILYDGALEKACLKKKISTCSQSEKQPIFTFASKLMKQHLLELWKQSDGPFTDKNPRYKAEIEQDELPKTPEGPTLSLCTMVDGVLVLPRDVRQEWMTDPVRSPEWRQLVQEFDRLFSTPAAAAANAAAASASPTPAANAGSTSTTAVDWQRLFGAPMSSESFQQTFADKIKGKFAWCPELNGYLVQPTEGGGDDEDSGLPVYQLFLEATQDYKLDTNDAFLTYGAGAWLTDSKADQFLENAPSNHRGVLCAFHADSDLAILEEQG